MALKFYIPKNLKSLMHIQVVCSDAINRKHNECALRRISAMML